MSSLIWFRRDLRIQDNPALSAALKHGATSAIFISTPEQWRKHHQAPIQADFIQRHLQQLSQQLKQLGISLQHFSVPNYRNQIDLLHDYCHKNNINKIFVNRELEANELSRDAKLNIKLVSYQSDTIAPLGKIKNSQGDMFKVFTPFKKAWLSYVKAAGIDVCDSPAVAKGAAPDIQDSNASYHFGYPSIDSSRWPLSNEIITKVIPYFLTHKLSHYSELRDFPAIKGTSGLSPYLAIGAISPRWLALQLIQQQPEVLYDNEHPCFAWLNQLIWRDFYRHLLFHYPNLIKGHCFKSKYQDLPWPNNPDYFDAWCNSQTGYPIIDAAMKQLVKTGWMHNRLRMLTASFLTKHLLIDWRLGERFFMSHLIDGDFSANNGGWQWIAGTGCDAQPYFRIFNPITQSKKFDPNGDFIRKYLPELGNVPNKFIHFPYQYLEQHGQSNQYCPPIVEHKQARLNALDFYK